MWTNINLGLLVLKGFVFFFFFVLCNVFPSILKIKSHVIIGNKWTKEVLVILRAGNLCALFSRTVEQQQTCSKKKIKTFIDQVITDTTDIENYKQQKAAPHTEHAVSVVRSSGISIEWEEHKLTKIVFPPPYKPELKKKRKP